MQICDVFVLLEFPFCKVSIYVRAIAVFLHLYAYNQANPTLASMDKRSFFCLKLSVYQLISFSLVLKEFSNDSS